MSTQASETASTMRAVAGKYLTFRLGHESYGIQVLKVREIIRHTTITSLPQMPAFIKGVINLRGKIIPVVDLRVRFALPTAIDTDRTCIIVVQVDHGAGLMNIGLVVDAVEEVSNIASTDIEETPDFGAAVDTRYITGMAKIHGAIKTLLDIDGILTSEESVLVEKTAALQM